MPADTRGTREIPEVPLLDPLLVSPTLDIPAPSSSSVRKRNPVSKIKLLREPSGRVRYLTDEEEGRLMAALPTEADRQRVTILLQTGFRKSEFFGLRWKDVDLRARADNPPIEERRSAACPDDVGRPGHLVSAPANVGQFIFPIPQHCRDA